MNNSECFYTFKPQIKSWLKEDLDMSWFPEKFPDYEWGEKRIWGLQYPPIEKVLSEEAIEFVRSMGYQSAVNGPDTINLFRGDPGAVMGIHHDLGPRFSINLCWGSKRSDMVWYKFKNPDETPRTYSKPSTTGRPTNYFYEEDLIEIGRADISVPTLVRTQIPHHVINYDTENHRWCFTLRNLNNKWTWEEAVEHFRPWLED